MLAWSAFVNFNKTLLVLASVGVIFVLGSASQVRATGRASAGPENFVFFNVERERIRDESFLESQALVGAQLKYRWRKLEPERDVYRFDLIANDLRFLESHGKKLFIQLQEVSFSAEIVNVPEYLREDPVFGGGVQQAFRVKGDDVSTAKPGGWVPRNFTSTASGWIR